MFDPGSLLGDELVDRYRSGQVIGARLKKSNLAVFQKVAANTTTSLIAFSPLKRGPDDVPGIERAIPDMVKR